LLVATLAALAAAALFAAAAALQHRSAGLVATAGSPRTGPEVTRFMAGTVRHPLWALGTAADVGGFALHALALRDGPLTLVQPLLVTGVVFALPLRQLLDGRRSRRGEVAWAGALAAGPVAFLVIATPANAAARSADVVPTIVLALVIGLGMTVCFVAGRRLGGARAALVLGTGAASAFAGVAGLLKETMGLLNHGAGTLVTAWPLYALVVVGLAGLVLAQLAYQAGPLSSSLPAITTVDPVLCLMIGVAVFDERFRNGPGDLVGEAVGLALVIVAAAGLTRSAAGPPGFRLPRSRKENRSPMTAPVASEAV